MKIVENSNKIQIRCSIQDQEEAEPTPTEEDAVEISVEMTGDQLTVTSAAKTRPSTLNTTPMTFVGLF